MMRVFCCAATGAAVARVRAAAAARPVTNDFMLFLPNGISCQRPAKTLAGSSAEADRPLMRCVGELPMNRRANRPFHGVPSGCSVVPQDGTPEPFYLYIGIFIPFL